MKATTTMDLNLGGSYLPLIQKRKQLEERISKSLQLPVKNIQLTNGSNGSLEFVISRLKLWGVKKAIIDVPNYYDTLKFLFVCKYKVQKIKTDSTFVFPLNQFLKFVMKIKKALVIVTCPNNPTGKSISSKALKKIIKALPADSILLIDRTCISTIKTISTKKLLHLYPHKKIVVLHSFSKTHGLSSKRIGYFATNNRKLTDFLNGHRDDGRVSLDAMLALEKVMDNHKIVSEKTREIRRSMKLIKEFCRPRKIFYTNSVSNFVLLQLSKELDPLVQRFNLPAGIKFSLSKKGYSRINISNSEHVKVFLEELKRGYEKKSQP